MLLTILIFFIDFMILGSTVDLRTINVEPSECYYNIDCPEIICGILSNKTFINMGLAFVALGFSESVICTKLPFISNATMISFIVDLEGKIETPMACDNVGECFTDTCILFNKNKNSAGMGFTGQCK